MVVGSSLRLAGATFPCDVRASKQAVKPQSTPSAGVLQHYPSPGLNGLARFTPLLLVYTFTFISLAWAVFEVFFLLLLFQRSLRGTELEPCQKAFHSFPFSNLSFFSLCLSILLCAQFILPPSLHCSQPPLSSCQGLF